ncbi:zinc metallopeptidase [Bengtsoniella intestinalis]|uniref:zinc metallopeptidase n=1 Tax=Bengtsoniella intestinalis TaxID=3073143 RepID=UPI00391FB8FB
MPYYSYYSYGYGDFLANNIYVLLLIPVIILSVWAQAKVSSNFKKYSKERNQRGLTGAQAAQEVLRMNGVTGVNVLPVSGNLTDHYNPTDNNIYLSDGVYSATTVAAVGVAAHEAGHAVQYAEGYAPIRIRNAFVPVAQFGSKFSFVLLLIGMFMYSQSLFLIGIILFSFTSLFQFITLPVEFDASRRALVGIDQRGLLTEDELSGAKKVLSAAAWTYVAALLMSLVQLLRFVLIFAGRQGSRD